MSIISHQDGRLLRDSLSSRPRAGTMAPNVFDVPRDVVVLGAAYTSLLSKPVFPKVWKMPAAVRKVALTAALTVSLFTAVAPMPAFAAQPIVQAVASQQVEPAKQVSAEQQRQAVDGALDDALQSIAGKDLKALGQRCIDSDAKCKADFGTLSKEGQDTYLKMPLAAKQAMAKQINGSYKILGFITLVNYRKAFESGQAFGKDTFKFATDQINQKEQAGKLSPSNAHHARWFLQISSRMTQPQRAALIRIINQDVKLAK